MVKIAAVIIVTLFTVTTYGQALQTDRPDQTESSNTIPKGTFQIESGIGIQVTQNDITGLNDRSFMLPTSLFRIAVANKFELRVVNTLYNNRSQNVFFGAESNWLIDNLQVGFKWKIAEGDRVKPQIGFMSHVVLPSGTNAVDGVYGVVNKLLFSHGFSNGWGLGYNLGYTYLGTGDGDLTYSISLAMPITEKLGAYIESYGAYENIQNFVTNADAGITYLLKDNIQLDYSFGVGITNRMNYQALGISVRLPK
ncbi:MAG: hypothetical protein GQ574_22185 [Crocinitomix sp.]|nr:hypothetical protein [Crocinitomix sp.]